MYGSPLGAEIGQISQGDEKGMSVSFRSNQILKERNHEQ